MFFHPWTLNQIPSHCQTNVNHRAPPTEQARSGPEPDPNPGDNSSDSSDDDTDDNPFHINSDGNGYNDGDSSNHGGDDRDDGGDDGDDGGDDGNDPSNVPTGNSNRTDESMDDIGSGTTLGTSHPHILRTSNLYLHPEKLSDDAIHSLIHCSKQQFLHFVHSISEDVYKKSSLSKYSQAFLFRLKLATNPSFGEIAEYFVISKRSARRIFWHLLQKVHGKNLFFPNLQGSDAEIEELFQKLYESEDPFYKELFGCFKDPQGKIIDQSILALTMILLGVRKA